MLENNNNFTAYNDFSQVSYIPYQIIDFLMKDNSQEAENIWKLLKYATVDALEKENLTFKEKKSMVWQGDSMENKYSIFFKPLVESSLDTAESQTQIRLFRYSTLPLTKTEAIICIEIDFITNDKTCLVNKNGMLVERTDELENLFLQIANGRDIQIGTGFLEFDKELVRSCDSQMSIGNSKTFFGRSLMIGLRYINAQTGGVC